MRLPILLDPLPHSLLDPVALVRAPRVVTVVHRAVVQQRLKQQKAPVEVLRVHLVGESTRAQQLERLLHVP